MQEDLVSLEAFMRSVVAELSGVSLHGFSPEDAEILIRVAFYGSLEAEEGRLHCFSLVLLDEFLLSTRVDGYTWRPVVLREPIELTVANVAKFAGAADLRYSHIAVRRTSTGLRIVGIVRRNSEVFRFIRGETSGAQDVGEDFLVVNATGPARIEVRVNSALVSTFHRGKQVPRSSVDLFAGGWLFKEMSDAAYMYDLPFEPYVATLRSIVQRLSERQHGGTLLVLPSTDTTDLSAGHMPVAGECAIRDALRYSDGEDLGVRSKFTVTNERDSDEVRAKRREGQVLEAAEFLRDAASFGADLGSIDGALALDRSLGILGFGCKITCEYQSPLPARLALNHDGSDYAASPLGFLGTRHNSAARFCFKHPSTIGFVVSQDGIVSCMHRAAESETLLVWRPVSLQWNWGLSGAQVKP